MRCSIFFGSQVLRKWAYCRRARETCVMLVNWVSHGNGSLQFRHSKWQLLRNGHIFVVRVWLLWLHPSFCQKTECYAQARSDPPEGREAHKSQVPCNEPTLHQTGREFFARKCQQDHYFRKHAFLQVTMRNHHPFFYWSFDTLYFSVKKLKLPDCVFSGLSYI